MIIAFFLTIKDMHVEDFQAYGIKAISDKGMVILVSKTYEKIAINTGDWEYLSSQIGPVPQDSLWSSHNLSFAYSKDALILLEYLLKKRGNLNGRSRLLQALVIVLGTPISKITEQSVSRFKNMLLEIGTNEVEIVYVYG
jgi:hypothetical protein